MKRYLPFILNIVLAMGLSSCQNDTSETDKIYPAQNDVGPAQQNFPCIDDVKKRGAAAALEGCMAQANAGDVDAIAQIGAIYANGQLGQSDWQEAMRWFMQAAQTGHPQAQYVVAQSLQQGRGVAKDEQAAFTWALRSAQGEYVPAQTLVGQFFLEGIGTPKNVEQGVAWLTKSVHKSHPPGMHQLAVFYLQHGGGDSASALMEPISLLQEAADLAYAPAQLELARLYHYGLKVKQNDNLAAKWYLEAATDEPEAMYQAGMIYLNGTFGQQKDSELGVNYLKQAAKAQYLPAQYALANMFLDGHPVLPDRFAAIEYLRLAAESGMLDAQLKLAKTLMEYALPQYDKVAFYWLNKASEQDSQEAMYLLANAFSDGVGTEINYEKALTIYTQLAEENYSLAQCKLARMYYEGKGTEKNLTLAKKWLLPAVKANVQQAQELAIQLFKEPDETPDVETTKNWINFAAERGEPAAIFQKGKNILFGQSGFEQDVNLGLALIREAAAKNYEPAITELKTLQEQRLFGMEEQLAGIKNDAN